MQGCLEGSKQMGNNFHANNDWGTRWAQRCAKLLEVSRCCWRCHSPKMGTAAGAKYACDKNFICKGTVTFESVEGVKGWQRLYDIDYIVHINCAGCPLLEAGEEVEVTQYHEFKANRQTHEERKTQNLVVETRENWQNYNRNVFGTMGEYGFKIGKWETNPITGNREQVRQGAGWWIKREELKREGCEGIVTDDAHKIADWYHFIQMFEEDDTMEVLDSTAAAFMGDETLSPGAALLRYYPLPYVVSVTGGYLRSLIEQKKYTVKSLGANARGYRIPVKDIVPSHLFEKTKNKEGKDVYSYLAYAGLVYGETRVKVHFISDWERRWERNKKGEWVEKDNAKPISLLIKKDREQKTEKIYIPREIRERIFEVYALKDAPAMYEQVRDFVNMLGLKVDLDNAQMLMVKPNETFVASKREDEIEQLGFFTDTLVYNWCEVYPSDEEGI